MPVLNLLRPLSVGSSEIVHADINAIVYRPAEDGLDEVNFREFSVFFHDELKTFYTRNFEELGRFGQFAGVRDGFAINYGASGMGAMLLANRKNIGPSADCVECLYEEFFLTSWANGDPALLERYVDDPANVHHSYLNDEVRFRNFHAGPKETHVFHLHAHQWFAGNDWNRGSYLDSQTVAPQQGFTYNIYDGGLDYYGQSPWHDSEGGGNRNRSPGDSIFHCHLYPHFAQGMWALWRNHDVLEDGTRFLPDGQGHDGLSLVESALPAERRLGSVDPLTGKFTSGAQMGSPIPAVVPLPNRALPPKPTYAADNAEAFPTADGEVPMRLAILSISPENRAIDRRKRLWTSRLPPSRKRARTERRSRSASPLTAGLAATWSRMAAAVTMPSAIPISNRSTGTAASARGSRRNSSRKCWRWAT